MPRGKSTTKKPESHDAPSAGKTEAYTTSLSMEVTDAAFTDKQLWAVIGSVDALRLARIARYMAKRTAAASPTDSEPVAIHLSGREEFDALRKLAESIAANERGAIGQILRGALNAEQHEAMMKLIGKRGPIGFNITCEWKPETQVWVAR